MVFWHWSIESTNERFLEMGEKIFFTGICRTSIPGRVEVSRSGEGSMQWQFRLSWILVVVVLLIVDGAREVCLAQSLNDANAYLDNIENEVMRVAAQATKNFVDTCDLVSSCGGSCSRQSCEPLEGDAAQSTCKTVALNPNCMDMEGNIGCSQLRVMLARSSVRLPTPSNTTLTSAANYTICSQRMLDPVFQNISQGHNSAINLTSWFYFGSVEGVQRSFPGRDVRPTNCTFEPRKRPWYMGATAVKKDLIILLDGGNSMGDSLPGDIFSAGNKFAASVNMIKELLDTLTYGDRVSVVLFTSTAKASLVYMSMTATANISDMQPLKDTLNALSADAKQGPSNLLSGLLKANQTFLANAEVLKIIIVITDGQFADSSLLTNTGPVLQSLVSQQVLVLLYSFDRTPTIKAALSQVACYVNGTYEQIEQTVMNPLWTLRSYFGIIAYWRMQAVGFKPYWSKPYLDSGSLGLVITVAYPAFAPDNYTLIGVVGSDVLMTELGSIPSTDFSTALAGRVSADPSGVSVVPVTLPCNVQPSNLNQCPSVVAPASPLCPSNDTSNISFEERVCSCPPECKAPPAIKTRISPTVIGAVGGVGALILIATVFFTVCCCRRRSLKFKVENQIAVVASNIPGSEKSMSEGVKSQKSSQGKMTMNSLVVSEIAHYPSSFLDSPSERSGKLRGSKSVKPAAWPVGNQTLSRDLIAFTLEELEGATGNWSKEARVGQGACGSVYKGELRGVKRAIKKPHPEVEVARATFDKELDLLSKLNHRCLVRLVGYCEDEHVLVFEFMEYGTLEDCLHRNLLSRHLTWEERLKIAAGASKGLEYLHEYCTIMIIHGDVKPANILLDDKLEAHIADFGLSLSSHNKESSCLWASRMGGTPGYIDPEYATLASFSPKSDVYSFGIVLLEIFSGRKVVQNQENITNWASELYDQDAAAILDPNLETPQGVESFRRIIALALQCVQRESRYRPKMKDVASKLNSAVADWQKFEHSVVNSVKHPSRRQLPRYRPLDDGLNEFETGP